MRVPNARRNMNLDRLGMTPLIDVIFQLLIFFMCASVGQLREDILPAELAPGTLGAPSDKPIEKPLGEVWLRLRNGAAGVAIQIEGNEFTDWSEAGQMLRSLAGTAPEIPVYLDNAPDVPFGDVVHAYDLCRSAGFQSIHFAVTKPTAVPNREARPLKD